MASQDSPALVGSPTSEGRRSKPVSLDGYTIEGITNHIIDAYHQGDESTITFCWPASEVNDLSQRLDDKLIELGERKIRRFEYDYTSKRVSLDIISETRLHAATQFGIGFHILKKIKATVSRIDDNEVKWLLQSVHGRGTAAIIYDNRLHYQPDLAFAHDEAPSSFVGEIAFNQPRDKVEKKAKDYIRLSDGKIQAAFIIDIEYPTMRKGWVSLRVADGTSGSWAYYNRLFFDDDLDEQPHGQVDFYLSDFIGLANSPAAFRRPSTARTDSGVSSPWVVFRFGELRHIINIARRAQDPETFKREPDNGQQGPLSEVERERQEMGQRMEQRIEQEIEQRMEWKRLEMEQRMKQKMEQRMERERQEMEQRMEQRMKQKMEQWMEREMRGMEDKRPA